MTKELTKRIMTSIFLFIATMFSILINRNFFMKKQGAGWLFLTLAHVIFPRVQLGGN